MSLVLIALAGCGSEADPGSSADSAPAITSTANTSESATNESASSTQAPPDQPEPAQAAEPDGADSPITLTLCSQGLPRDGMWKCDPVFADVNGDGNLDLAAIPRLGDGPKVWFGDGAGNWTEASNGLTRTDSKACGGGVRLHDVNNDGLLDLVVADHCTGVYVYLGDGKGNWELVVERMFPDDIVAPGEVIEKYRGAESIAVGDVNKDGNADLIVGGSDESGIRYYIGDGTGSGWSRLDGGLPEVGWAVRVELHDIDDDGWLDVIASYSAGPRVYLSEEQGTRWTDGSLGLPSPMMGGIFWGLGIADFNEDGREDIAVANWIDGPEIYLQGDDGKWTKSPDVFEQMLGGAQGLAVGDLDGDGHQDMVVSGRLKLEGGFIRGVFALRGDGTGGGGWEYLADCGLPARGLGGMAGVGLADINNDGTLDVAACSGLIVETVPSGPREPTLPFKLLIWCNDVAPRAAASATGD